jgi:hypothetical protein
LNAAINKKGPLARAFFWFFTDQRRTLALAFRGKLFDREGPAILFPANALFTPIREEPFFRPANAYFHSPMIRPYKVNWIVW